MANLSLNYVTHSGGNPSEMEAVRGIARYLAKNKRINFLPDSEILQFGGDSNSTLWMCVVHAGSYGHIPGGCYANRNSNFPERTREKYLRFILQGFEIFPMAAPEEALETGAEFAPSDTQRLAFQKLIATYIDANPDPYPRLALLGSSQNREGHMRDMFMRLACEVADPVEICILDAVKGSLEVVRPSLVVTRSAP